MGAKGEDGLCNQVQSIFKKIKIMKTFLLAFAQGRTEQLAFNNTEIIFFLKIIFEKSYGSMSFDTHIVAYTLRIQLWLVQI